MNKIPIVAIIGAGPLGLELAIALKTMGIVYVHFDKGQVGQIISNYPPNTQFFSSSERIGIAQIAIQTVGQQKCTREEYLAYLRSIIMSRKLLVNTYEEVFEIHKELDETFTIQTICRGQINCYQVKYVVMATGGISQPRSLNVPGEYLPHVYWKMEEPHKYFQKEVVIIGGRNSATESALRLSHAGANVTMVVRSPKFEPQHIKYWLLPELEGKIDRGEISCFFNSVISEIDSKTIKILNNNTNFEIKADFIIKAIGFEADMRLLSNLGVILTEGKEAPYHNTETMETNIPGVFVLGTVVGGSQKKYRVFIENTHVHVDKIMRYLCEKLKISTSPEVTWKITLPANKPKVPEE